MVMARVDGEAYKLFGCSNTNVTAKKPVQKSIEFTSTHTTITSQAGSTKVTLDFFSPVDPDDFVRQSLPFSYLTVSMVGDANSDIDIFSAIDGSWTGQDAAPNVARQEFGDIQMFNLAPNSPVVFGEANEMSQWGETIFATSSSSATSNMSCGQGSPNSIISAFEFTGVLPYSNQSAFDRDHIVACSHSFRNSENNVSATFVVGLYHNEVINYAESSGNATQVGYYRSQFNTLESAVQHFFEDYDAALAQSAQLDEHIRQMGHEVSANYSDILEFSVRQSCVSAAPSRGFC